MAGFLGHAYPWVKAAHVTFVIFWIAGLFIVPRYYIHHQATTPGSAEDRAWIVDQFKRRHPHVPVIGFPKGAGGKLRAYAAETKVDAIGLDETVDPAWAARELPSSLPVQGNLDPLALIAGGETLRDATMRILDAFADRPHIFNLGHGIQQTTPIAHVDQLVALVKGLAK